MLTINRDTEYVIANNCYLVLGRHPLVHNHYGYGSHVTNGYDTSAATDITVPTEEKKKKKKHKKVQFVMVADE